MRQFPTADKKVVVRLLNIGHVVLSSFALVIATATPRALQIQLYGLQATCQEPIIVGGRLPVRTLLIRWAFPLEPAAMFPFSVGRGFYRASAFPLARELFNVFVSGFMRQVHCQ